MKFTLTMNMDNAAFGNGPLERTEEVVRIFADLMTKLNEFDRPACFDPGFKMKIRDTNGNHVGMLEVTE